MNTSKFNISAMNYAELDNLARTIEANGQTIYDSLYHIRATFEEMRDAGFAGSTLTAVLNTLSKLGNLPEDVRNTCEQFKKYADQAIDEVTGSENQVLQTLREIIDADPLKYELPEWYSNSSSGSNLNANDII